MTLNEYNETISTTSRSQPAYQPLQEVSTKMLLLLCWFVITHKYILVSLKITLVYSILTTMDPYNTSVDRSFGRREGASSSAGRIRDVRLSFSPFSA